MLRTHCSAIVSQLQIGSSHTEYDDYGDSFKCKVITTPNLKSGIWRWQSKNEDTGDLINYTVKDVNSDEYWLKQWT